MLTAIQTKSVITPHEEIPEAVILVEDGVVKRLASKNELEIPAGARLIEAPDRIVAPGFVDIHVHGGAGFDLMQPSDEVLSAVSASLFRHGTTAYYPTTVTASRDQTLSAVEYLGQAIKRMEAGEFSNPGREEMATPLGIHLEGPFISMTKRGTHPIQHIMPPSKEFLNDLLDASDERIEILTIAPEIEGAVEFIRYAKSLDLKIGLGHSNATFEETERAINAGATHAVHLFNAMRPWNQRDPGIVGAALADPRLSCEIIADGIHVHPLNVQIAFRQKSFEKILGVTDATSATSMPDGRYQLAGFEIEVKNGVCLGPDGQLAGSTLTQDRVVKHLVDWHCCSFREALQTASLNIARLMGIEAHHGSIAAGMPARFNFFDQNLAFVETKTFE
ncbi:MAG: N-acetylglucosamine-6-phosphate deacetylase [Terriglobia bacterium]